VAAVDGKINILVDGLRQVKKLNEELNRTSRSIGQINRQTVKAAVKDAQKKDKRRGDNFFTKQNIPSLNNLNKTLGKAASNFNKVDISSDKARVAAEELAKSEMALNQVLKEKNRLLAEAQTKLKLQNLNPNELTGQSSPLNFGARGELLRGRRGSNKFSLRNLGRRFDRSSALIGGGFPLLFGGGPIQALAGGLGGGIGGMFGKMGGFAGSIAATAAVQSIQEAITAVGDLGKAMSPVNQNTQALSNALGLVGTPAGKYLETLEQTQGKQVAFNEAMRRMENLVGVNGVKALQDFGESTRKLQQDITTFLTRIAAKAAELLNNIGGGGGGGTGRPVGLARANLLAQGRNTTTGPLADEIQEVVAKLETANRKTRAGLQDELIELVKKRNLLQENLDITNDANKKFQKTLENFTEENEHLQNVLRLGKEGAQIEQEKLRIAKELKKEVADLTPQQVLQISNSVKLNNQLKEQRQIQEQIQNILAGGMTNAVMGLIEGTKTLGQVLADVAKQLASMFLNKAFSSIFSNMFAGSGVSGIGPVASGSQYASMIGGAVGLYSSAGSFKAFRQGGIVTSPTMGIIGEGGESEYVIPASKMDGAMARYSAGARGGAVIPGGSHESGTVAGSSGNTVVEYTGPTLNFNGDEYVPKSAVPEIIGAAAKQGAMAGKAQTFNALKNSRSQRASLGL